jgi:hypothetical protein
MIISGSLNDMIRKQHIAKPVFSSYLFWDCKKNTIDIDKEKSFVIERVVTRGKETDEIQLFHYYGAETIKNIVLQLNYLDKKTLNYLSVVFDVDIKEFKCYKKTLSKDPFGMF